MLTPSHTGLTIRLRRSCDQKKLQSSTNRRQIVERTYDWSHKSWVIAWGKSVATKLMVMFKTCNQLFQIISGRTISHWSCHLTTGGTTTNRLLTDTIKCGDVSGVQVTHHTMPDARFYRSQNSTIDRTIDRRGPRLIVRSIGYGSH